MQLFTVNLPLVAIPQPVRSHNFIRMSRVDSSILIKFKSVVSLHTELDKFSTTLCSLYWRVDTKKEKRIIGKYSHIFENF